MKEEYYFVGVDVGTRSVRAALVSCTGKVQNVKTIPISVINRKSDFYEQKSEEIWSVVSQAVKGVVSHVDISKIKGIGFDATCSLVVLDGNFNPIAVNNQEDDSVNIIMWLDHRAKEEADTINSKNYGFLKYVGGNVSLEMQMPKLLWLKKNLPECWRKAEHFMDLPDFLTFKATGSLSRSLCSLVCKWSYGHGVEKCGWDETFLADVGLGDLCRENYAKIGNNALRPGMKVGGISSQAAAELGLLEGTSVGVSIIDAHAGGLALMYANSDAGKEAKWNDLSDRLAMICGTSTCHMSLNCEPLFVKGVWGPYLDAMVPKLWLNEGGQSSTGGLIDHVVQSHPAVSECPKNVDVYTWIEDILDRMTTNAGLVDSSLLTDQIHVYPDFHGNRSPLADPTMKGMISGLSLNCSRENLALLYLATLQCLAVSHIGVLPHPQLERFLKYVGGNVSLEMQMPKLLWLKKNLPECWRKAEHFMDLPDFLTFKATGSLSRSLCSLVCKWSYGHGVEKCGWDETFLADVGLGDLCRENYAKIGNNALRPGMKVGGISSQAAAELGLLEGTSVGVSIIDAHAGGLALMYANSDAGKEAKWNDLSDRLAMICGTSTCHMSLNCEPLFVKGVWGPYLDAMVPKLWLNEGGQSSTGGLIDHVVQSHPAVSECPKNVDVYTWIEDILDRMTTNAGLVDSSLLTDQIHVYPDFHGNRSPLADPTMKGMISGLSLNCSRENLALLYLATLQCLAYGTKDIVDALASSGQRIETVLMCGGLNRSSKFAQINADVLGLQVLIPHTKESVLLGAAILGAAASGLFGVEGDLEAVASVMAGGADELTPRKELRRFHQKKFQVFKKMQSDQREYKAIMNGTP